MSEGRYNIPKQYKVDKGMPLNILFQRIDNAKCREIFETDVGSITWSYQITDEDGISDANALIRQKGISVFEVVLKNKISAELLTPGRKLSFTISLVSSAPKITERVFFALSFAINSSR